jgi:16S rRNA (adenine1518-N6/adenine1519-N6)-dimethyltransferase
MRQHAIKFKHALGQNFLIERKVLEKIIEVAQLNSSDTIVEIGAGIGTLTVELCKIGGKVISFEKDEQLRNILKDTVQCQNSEIRIEDFLDANLELPEKYKVVSNLPYQITTPVVRRFLEKEKLPEKMVLLVQKEVAERLSAKPGSAKRGWVTVLVQLIGTPSIATVVQPDSFMPAPEVESAILVIEDLKRPDFNLKKVLTIVKAGFSAKRRQLPNSIAGGLGLEIGQVREITKKSGIGLNKRAEDLTNGEWLKLAQSFDNEELGDE